MPTLRGVLREHPLDFLIGCDLTALHSGQCFVDRCEFFKSSVVNVVSPCFDLECDLRKLFLIFLWP
jgi:hypothetical protein